MKVLTRKSRTAILIFLSVITLTLVAHITIAHPQTFKDTSFNQFLVETTTYKQLKQSTTENKPISGSWMANKRRQLNDQTIVAFCPWTVQASPRAPPV